MASLQIVEVTTAHGTGVIASDVCHHYRNLEEGIPTGIIRDLPRICLG